MGKIRKQWTDAQLGAALDSACSGRSVNSISKLTGIPKSTLLLKLKRNCSVAKKPGPQSILTPDEEAELVRWILHLSNRGFPITKTLFLANVAQLIKKLNRKNPFPNEKPGRHWYEGFLRRHPEIARRTAQNLNTSRNSVHEESLRAWFSEVGTDLDKRNLRDIPPNRKFNCDESAFYLCPQQKHVLTKKGDKAVYNFIMNNNKECLTVLFMLNAEDLMVPPMIVFPYERLSYGIAQSVPGDWGIGKSPSGWMTGETFFEYISNVFEKFLTQHNIERPVVLFVDGHSSHFTLPVVEFCQEHQIELVVLYPNATHLLQPLDVALFRGLKASWLEVVNEWRTKNETRLRREDFAGLLKTAIDSIDLPVVMANGFRKCGLHPFTADALEFSALLQKKKEGSAQSARRVSISKNEAEIGLRVLESVIDQQLLQEFRTAKRTGTWDNGIENLNLYFTWLKVLKMSRDVDTVENEETDLSNKVVEVFVVENDTENLNPIRPEKCPETEEMNFDSTFNLLIENSDLQYPSIDEGFSTTNSSQNHLPALEISPDGNEAPADPLPIRTQNVGADKSAMQPQNDHNCEKTPPVDDGNKENNCSVSEVGGVNNQGHIPPDVPQVFKDTLFWPRNREETNKKRAPKVKVSSVATSEAWIEYHRKKEAEKLERESEIEHKKRKRREAAEGKQQLAKQKKIERESKKQKAAEEKQRLAEQKKIEHKSKRQETQNKKQKRDNPKKEEGENPVDDGMPGEIRAYHLGADGASPKIGAKEVEKEAAEDEAVEDEEAAEAAEDH